MITLPDPSKAFEYENGFYLTCDITRVGKLLAHYELFQRVTHIPGALVECGVFKGASFARFAALRSLFGNPASRKLIGFDIFGRFPDTAFEPDKQRREAFVNTAGDQSIAVGQLLEVLRNKKCADSVELIAGDICETVPRFAREHPELRIALLNLDIDLYEPAKVILEHLYPRIERGGILILDDYGVFPGETQAVDEYFSASSFEIRKFPFCTTPCYLVKK